MNRSKPLAIAGIAFAALVCLPTMGCNRTISRSDPQHKDNLTDRERNSEGEGKVTAPPVPVESGK
jgi:hypothetical protein